MRGVIREAGGGGSLVAGDPRAFALPVQMPVAPPALEVKTTAPRIEAAFAVGLACHPAPAVQPDDHRIAESTEVGREWLIRDLRGEEGG